MNVDELVKWILGLLGSGALIILGIYIRWSIQQFKDCKKSCHDTEIAILKSIINTSNELSALEEKIYNNVVHKNDYISNQKLWQSNFDHMLEKFTTNTEQNTKDHSGIVEIMNKNTDRSLAQTVDFAEKIDALRECVQNIELNKPC